MNKIISKNIQTFLKAKGRNEEWIIERLGMDAETFKKLLNGEEEGILYLEKFAKLFRKNVEYFKDENMVPPLTVEEITEKYKEMGDTPQSEVAYTFTKLLKIEDDLQQAEGIVNYLQGEHPQPLLAEILQLINELEMKSVLLLKDAERKEDEEELDKLRKEKVLKKMIVDDQCDKCGN
ncbi:hypothetical protein MZM54_05220 [[Brevibacterium] frigoritolerans]|nr:hypothetical protein [Peribacillus frigoritolerans]